MARYFIEVAYLGAAYAGFQVQENAATVQSELDKGLSMILRTQIATTGSSRTDAGVHARQNFLHFDFEGTLNPQLQYKMNAVLPGDIAVNGIYSVPDDYHSRFAALGRSYEYRLYSLKDPFLRDRGYYFPYKLDFDLLQQAATIVKEYTDFTSFSKRNTQVHSFNCAINYSYWTLDETGLMYHVSANRFLRGMVRGLVGTMLRVGRGKLSVSDFHAAIQAKDCTRVDFAVPPQGLSLIKVAYPDGILQPI